MSAGMARRATPSVGQSACSTGRRALAAGSRRVDREDRGSNAGGRRGARQPGACHPLAKGAPWASYALHVCGNTKVILADLVTTGAGAVELDYKTDVRLAHHLLKDSTVFIGNLDSSTVVALGTSALIEAKSRELFGDPPLHPERRLRHPGHRARGQHPSQGARGPLVVSG